MGATYQQLGRLLEAHAVYRELAQLPRYANVADAKDGECLLALGRTDAPTYLWTCGLTDHYLATDLPTSDLPACLLTYLFTYSLTHPLTHPPTHSPTHPLAYYQD